MYISKPLYSLALCSLSLFSFPLYSMSHNAEAVENCLHAINPSPKSDLGSVASHIDALSPDQENAALNQLQPSLFKGFSVTQEQNTTNVRKAISRRLDERNYCQCDNEEKLAVWADIYGDHASQKKRENQPGYIANTGAGVVGLDVLPVEPLIVGIAAAYSYSHFHWSHNVATGHSQAAYGSLYAGVTSKYIYANAAIIGGWLNEKGTRRISFPGIKRSATHSNDGGEGAAHIDLGFNKNVYDVFTIIPFGAGDYIYIHEGSYTEQGASSLNLQVASNNSQLVRGEAGLKLARCFDWDEYTFAFDIRASWIREMRLTGKHYKSNFQDTHCTFTTTGYFLNRSLLGIGADIIGFVYNDNVSFALGFDAEYGAHYSDQLVDLHIEWRI